MALSWAALGERLNLQPTEFEALRGEPDAPKTRNVKEWLAFTAQYSKPKAMDLPGHNDYDKPVSRGDITYTEALTREKVREQEIINERRQVELDQQRGKLVTKEQAQELLQAQRDEFLTALGKLGDIAKKDFIVGDQPGIKKKAKKWQSEICRLVEAGLNKK